MSTATIKTEKLVIAISSRALFDLTDSHGVFESEGVKEGVPYFV